MLFQAIIKFIPKISKTPAFCLIFRDLSGLSLATKLLVLTASSKIASLAGFFWYWTIILRPCWEYFGEFCYWLLVNFAYCVVVHELMRMRLMKRNPCLHWNFYGFIIFQKMKFLLNFWKKFCFSDFENFFFHCFCWSLSSRKKEFFHIISIAQNIIGTERRDPRTPTRRHFLEKIVRGR